MTVEWSDPPSSGNALDAAIAEVILRPGTWGLLRRYASKGSADTAAHRLRTKYLSLEIVSRRIPDSNPPQWGIWARTTAGDQQ